MNAAILVALILAAPEPLPRRSADPVRWYAGDAFYEISPRTFAGNLSGLTKRLDLLSQLGVTGVSLLPIFASPREDGYAVSDWERVDPRLGSMADVEALILAAHQRGLAVLLSFVPNHVSREHVWFRAAETGDRLAQDRFVFTDQKPEGWSKPGGAGEVWTKSEGAGRWYYHAFDASMPDLDLRDRPTRAQVGRAAEAWLERGFDGLRLDAIRFLIEDGRNQQVDRPQTLAIVRELGAMGRRHNALLIGSARAEHSIAASYLDPLPLVLDFDRASAIDHALERGTAGELEPLISRAERLAPSGTMFAPFTTTHDWPVPRASTYGPDAQVLANALVLSSGGVPFLFQGDEIGAADLNSPIDWELVEKQRADPASVWSRTRRLLAVRKESAALRFGLRWMVPVKGGPGLFAFLRHDGRERVLVIFNFAAQASTAAIDLRGRWRGLFPAAEDLGRKIVLPARGVAIFRAEESPGSFVVRFGAPGMLQPSGASIAIDRGLMFEERRGMGFSRDAVDQLRCSKDKKERIDRCVFTFSRRSRFEETHLRWLASLPPGPYNVEVVPADVKTKLDRPLLEAEGEPLLAKGKSLVRTVFVRDGLLSIAAVSEDRGATPIAVSEIRIAPAPFRFEKIPAEVLSDRVVLRASGPGVVEWRMNNASTEPVEQAPIIKKGGRWEATLGPWPKGAVSEVAFVIRSDKGPFVTAERGAELVVKIE